MGHVFWQPVVSTRMLNMRGRNFNIPPYSIEKRQILKRWRSDIYRYKMKQFIYKQTPNPNGRIKVAE